MPNTEEVEEVTAQAKELQSSCYSARTIADRLKKQYLEIQSKPDFALYVDNEYWQSLICREALIKLANITERDLKFMTTFSVLMSARYLMEMLIWLRLIARDPDQFISYFIALQISEQLQHVKATLENTKRELEIYSKIAKRQSEAFSLLRKRSSRNVSRALYKHALPRIGPFCSYELEARKKGFAPVAAFLETEVVKRCNGEIDVLQEEYQKARKYRKCWLNKKWIGATEQVRRG